MVSIPQSKDREIGRSDHKQQANAVYNILLIQKEIHRVKIKGWWGQG